MYTFAIAEEDAQSKPDVSAAAAQKLLSDDNIHVVFGILTSTPGMAAAVPIGKAKVLYIGGFTSLDTLIGKPGNELFFRALDSDAIAAGPFVQETIKEFGVKKIGMLLPNEDVSKSIVKTYQPLFEKAGVQVPIVEYFQPGTSDFAPVLRKFQRQGLDGLFIGYSDPDAEAIVRQSLEVGGLPTRFVYRGGSGAPAAKYAPRIDGFAWQILTRDLDTTSDAKVKAWIDRYKAATKKDVTATTYWALTFYDTLFMLSRAMEAAGSVTDAKAIADKLKGMKYDGVRQMQLDPQGFARTDIDIGFIKGGKTYSTPAHIQ
jgi:branched-chain amino acid transport system substrate-binding protein